MSRRQELPASFLASYPHPCFFPGPGFKRDRCGQRHGGPLLPTGVSLACPAGPWSQPLLQPVLPGRPALSRMAVGMAVGQSGPPCLTISLAPVGIFLETRRSRAGDGGQGGWMGREDGKRGGRAGKAVGELGEWGSQVLSARGSVKGCCWPQLKPFLRNPPEPLPGVAPPPQWDHLVSSRPLPWGPGKEEDLAWESCQPWWICRRGQARSWARPCDFARQLSGAGLEARGRGRARKHSGLLSLRRV